MEHRWRISCCGLPLIFTLGACAALLLVVAASPTPERQPNQMAGEQANPTPSVPHSSTEIRILDRSFTRPQLAQGRVIYVQYCAACHGADGQGQFPEAPLEPDSTGRIGASPHNETGHSWHHSDVQLIRYVTEGGFSDPARFYTMPSFGGILTDQQILLVIAYIKTLWTDEQRAMQRQLTEDEEKLFSG